MAGKWCQNGAKGGVGHMPATTGVVGQGNNRPGDVMVSSKVAVVELMQCVEAEKICARRHRRGRALRRPRHGSAIVTGDPQGAFSHVIRGRGHVLVRNHSRQLEIGDGQCGLPVGGRGDQGAGDARREALSPQNGGYGAVRGEPHASMTWHASHAQMCEGAVETSSGRRVGRVAKESTKAVKSAAVS